MIPAANPRQRALLSNERRKPGPSYLEGRIRVKESQEKDLTPEKIAVIVDAYSTGSMLPAEFKKFGIECIHIQSSSHITVEFVSSFRASDFKRKFVVSVDTELQAIAESLKTGHQIICVTAGTETGVEVAEKLAALLGLPGNDPTASRLRRDKYMMHERLRSVGLSSLSQSRCESREAALSWAKEQDSWPIVVKPTASAGADGVVFCHDLHEIAAATDAVLGKRNKLGEINEAVVLQHKLYGQQFIVNAVSKDGAHHISEIWRDDKIPIAGASLVCDREILISPETALAKSLQEYVVRCLDALGIKDGPISFGTVQETIR